MSGPQVRSRECQKLSKTYAVIVSYSSGWAGEYRAAVTNHKQHGFKSGGFAIIMSTKRSFWMVPLTMKTRKLRLLSVFGHVGGVHVGYALNLFFLEISFNFEAGGALWNLRKLRGGRKSLIQFGNRLKGIHHYYTLHRLSVQIEVPSRCSISKKKLVCL